MRPRNVLFLSCLALSILASAAPANAQGFHSVFSRDGTDVWAVGDGGVIYRSFSGGASWTSTTLGQRTLRDVAANYLTVVVVSDSGKVWRSQDSGGSWALTVIPGAPDLHVVAATSSFEWYAAGANGTILKSVDGGGSWTPQTSGTAALLRALRFTDPQHGWAVGNAGTVLRTDDGGALWTPVSVTSSATLYDVDVNGSTVWVVGADATARKSVDGGTNWTIVNLKFDSRADVRAVALRTPDFVFLAGGGGFIRRSLDGGSTWFFPNHLFQAPISSMFFGSGRAWACSDRNRIVLTSNDQDLTWALPTGTSVTHSWDRRTYFGGNTRGNTLQLNPVYKNTLYAGLGDTLFRSRDDGESWAPFATIPSCNRINALVVSQRDSNQMLVAVGIPKRVMKSINGGASWTTTLTHDFGEFGVPLEIDHDRPDTVFFGGDSDKLQRSTDFGTTWNPVSTMTFRSPCDIVSMPDSGNVIVLGDGITGSGRAQYYKSTDWGQTFVLTNTRPNQTSEIPSLACSRLRNSILFGTNWGSSGSMQRSTDYGSTWPTVLSVNGSWGIDIAGDDPNCVMMGQYAGGFCYLALDGGDYYAAIDLPAGSNYAMFARDRATIIAQQDDGLYKFRTQYGYAPDNTQALNVVSPNGGEVWAAGSTHQILWNPYNIALARIEYRRSPGEPWQLVDTPPGYYGAVPWTLPKDATTSAKIRVRDAWDSTPTDSSNAAFTITVSPQLTVDPNPLDLPATPTGTTTSGELNLDNPGTGAVTISSVTSDNPLFWPGRTSIVIPAHAGDSLGVYYSPNAQGQDTAHVTIVSDDPGSPRVVLVTGTATAPTAVGDHSAAGFALWQNQPNPFTGTTRIDYRLPVSAAVRLDVFDLLGHRMASIVNEWEEPGLHHATFGPGARTVDGERVGALASGVYFYRFQAGAFAGTRKMLVMR